MWEIKEERSITMWEQNRNNFSDHYQSLLSLQACFMGMTQSSGETNWYWYRLKANLDQVFNLGLSLSQHFWGETFWCVHKWCRSPAWGLGRLGGVFWEYKTVLAHKVCIFLSLDWMAGHDPGFSNSLCIQNSLLCIPRCVSSTQSHACKLHCWKTWYDGATWS